MGSIVSAQGSIQINQSVHAALNVYIPNAIINTSTYYPVNYYNSKFLVMQINNNYILINASSPYQIITNNSIEEPIMRVFLLNAYALNQSLLLGLKDNISTFVNKASQSVSQCLVQTGLNGSYTCTNANYCYSCQTVNGCSTYLANSNTQPVIQSAIINFSKQYDIYNKSYGNFSKIESKINQTNYYNYINQLTSNASSIIQTPAALQHNALFGTPSGFNMNLFKNCPAFVSLNSPWYCQLLSFCNTLTFNNTLANNVQTDISKINALPISTTDINKITYNSTALAASYVDPVYIKQNTALYSKLITNSSMVEYNTAITNATYINSKVYNAQMYQLTSTLQNTFNTIKSKGIYQNITSASITLSSLAQKTQIEYKNISLVYIHAYNLSQQASAAVLSKQIDYPSSVQLANLAKNSAQLSAMFNSRINYSQIPLIAKNASTILESAATIPSPFSMSNFVKSTDSFFVFPLSAATAQSLPSRMGVAPLYAALLSFIIGIIILALIYQLTYVKMLKRHKIKISKSVQRAWMKLFVILFIIVLIYVYLTYMFAVGANNGLPIEGFTSIYNKSTSAYVLLNKNTTINASVSSCINSITAQSKAQNRTITIINETNYECSVSKANTFANPNCISSIPSSTPIILISENGSNYLEYNGAFGYVLYAGGSVTSGNECYLSKIIN